MESTNDPVGKQASRSGDEDFQWYYRWRILALFSDIDVDHADGGERRVTTVCYLREAKMTVLIINNRKLWKKDTSRDQGQDSMAKRLLRDNDLCLLFSSITQYF